MISRTLVPRDVKPVNGDEPRKAGSRLTTYMDDRMVVPAGPSDAPPLNGKSNIPQHMPLDVLVNRLLVPRDLPIKPIERSVETQEKGVMALEVLDARRLVPAHVKPLEPEQQELFAPIDTVKFRDVIEPDMFITGDANLLIEPEEKRDAKWDNLARIGSIAAHILLILFLINIGRIFKPTVPTQADLDRAQKELSFVYLPPETPTPAPPVPKMPRLDPKMLERMAPPVEKPLLPEPAPQPPPQPVKPQPDLPEAPTPHVATPQPPQQQPPQVAQNTQPLPSQLEPIKPQNNHLNLQLPSSSPGQILQQQEQNALKNRGGGTFSTQGQFPAGPGGPGAGPSVGNQVQILTPTEGVDFNSYIQRMLDTIRRNWYAVMPQSAMLGDKGVVYVTFQINPDGSIQASDPQMLGTSGKPPLDNAAVSSIRASNPFEPLPREFHGPYMRFGIYFLYNLPVEYLNHH
jgi:TonB family protein